MDRRGVVRKHLRFREILDELPAAVAAGPERRPRAGRPAARPETDRRGGRIFADAAHGKRPRGDGRQNDRFCELWEGLARGLGGAAARRAPIEVGGGVSVEVVERRERGPRAAAADGAGAVAARRARRRSASCRCRRTSKPRAGGSATAAPAVDDRTRYQTVYAAQRRRRRRADRGPALHAGAAVRDRRRRSRDRDAHAATSGPGTFRPVEVDDPRAHRLDPERYRISPDAADGDRARPARAAARGRGRHDRGALARGVGARARRRGACRATRETDSACCPATNSRSSTDLITNFHLPRSTLLMLVAAFAGARPCWRPTARRSSAAIASTATATRC